MNDQTFLRRFFYVVTNWLLVFTSPLWVIPVLFSVAFENKSFTKKLLKGDGSII